MLASIHLRDLQLLTMAKSPTPTAVLAQASQCLLWAVKFLSFQEEASRDWSPWFKKIENLNPVQWKKTQKFS